MPKSVCCNALHQATAWRQVPMNVGGCPKPALHPTWHHVLLKDAKGENPAQEDSQKHFLCTIVGPDSSYSPLEIHICWKVLSDERIEPPIHTEYLRSGGATTLIFMVEGARAVSSFVMRSPMPPNIVVPPESTTLL